MQSGLREDDLLRWTGLIPGEDRRPGLRVKRESLVPKGAELRCRLRGPGRSIHRDGSKVIQTTPEQAGAHSQSPKQTQEAQRKVFSSSTTLPCLPHWIPGPQNDASRLGKGGLMDTGRDLGPLCRGDLAHSPHPG